MSEQYDNYLKEHRANVKKGWKWLVKNLPKFLPEFAEYDDPIYENIFDSHDSSKDDVNEYLAYDRYFYGKNKSYKVVTDFQNAWLHHIHLNLHHWQHWVLINDDPKEGVVTLEMPDDCIIEMICDWWSFSWKTGNLYGIFDWYEERKDFIKLHPRTRGKVEKILTAMRNALDNYVSKETEGDE